MSKVNNYHTIEFNKDDGKVCVSVNTEHESPNGNMTGNISTTFYAKKFNSKTQAKALRHVKRMIALNKQLL